VESVSTIHWLIFAFIALVLFVKSIVFWSALALALLLLIVSPVLGVVRSTKRSSIANCIASLLIPFYGLVYFFCQKLDNRWQLGRFQPGFCTLHDSESVPKQWSCNHCSRAAVGSHADIGRALI